MAEKTSVKSYQQNTEMEKQKMKTYANKMKTNVKSLQADARKLAGSFKNYSKDLRGAALKMREDGVTRMRQKVGKFSQEIKEQIKENKRATAHMADNVNFFQSEIDQKKKDFQAYARGPFRGYIKAFWG